MVHEMEKQIRFERCLSREEITALRKQYLDGLIEPQELYLELMIHTAEIFVIFLGKDKIGYFIIGNKCNLLEYFIIQQNIHLADEILKIIIQEFSLRTALCKSFDHLLLSCCACLQIKTSVLGILFREYNPSPYAARFKEITIRPATLEDEKHIIQVNEEVFDHDHEVLEYINKLQLLIFEKERKPIGFGIFSKVIEGRPDFDIGMLVEKDFRRQGVGQFIIRYLADYCYKNGWRPIAGCDAENVGSRRTLEKAGFIARYRLLEFSF